MVVNIGQVRQQIKPKADSTLQNMRKTDLIKYIRCLEHNYNVAVSFNENQARYIESLGATVQKWIPVEQGLPTSDDIPDYAEYDYHLVCCKSPINGKYTVRPALASYDGFADKRLISCHGLTHWMPLPKPPKEEP